MVIPFSERPWVDGIQDDHYREEPDTAEDMFDDEWLMGAFDEANGDIEIDLE